MNNLIHHLIPRRRNREKHSGLDYDVASNTNNNNCTTLPSLLPQVIIHVNVQHRMRRVLDARYSIPYN